MDALPRAHLPEDAGFSSEALLQLIDRAKAEGLELHSLMVLKGGQVACEMSWAPYDLDRPHTLFSLTKSFTSTAAALAVGEGLIRYEDSIADILPDKLSPQSDRRVKDITLHSLLCMGSGLDPRSNLIPPREEDWVKAALKHPVLREPGTHFHYSSMGSHLISAMVQRATGQTCLDYLMPRMFDKLGIARPQWDSCPMGMSMGGYGLHLSCRDIAKFGQLLLQGGVWQGEQLLPEGWVALASEAKIDNLGFNNHIAWGLGYGYQFWRSRGDRFRADGMYGQLCIVDEANDMVIACTAGILETGPLLDLIDDLLPPAAGLSPADEQTQQKLQRRIKGLAYRLPRHQEGMPQLSGSYLGPQGRRLRLTQELDGNLSLMMHRRGEAGPPRSFRLTRGRPHRGECASLTAGEAFTPYLGQYSWHKGRLHLSIRMPGAPYKLLAEAQPQGEDLQLHSYGVAFDHGDFLYKKQHG